MAAVKSIDDSVDRTMNAIDPASPQRRAETKQNVRRHQSNTHFDLLENRCGFAVAGDRLDNGDYQRKYTDDASTGGANILFDHCDFSCR